VSAPTGSKKPSREFGNNLESLRGWRDAPADVREEMRLHADLRARDLEAHGLTPEAARAQAAREVGDRLSVEPAVASLAASTDRTSAWRQRVDEFRQDARYSLRSFRRTPGFTALALLTIALGLGANAAIFGVVNVAFFTPLPFDPDNTLVRVREYRAAADGSRQNVDASRRTADAVAARSDMFRASVAVAGTGRALARDGGAMRLAGTRVGPGFTSVVGIAPVIGRTFTAEEENAGDASAAALISHRVWQTVFGGEPSIIGQTIRLDGRPHAVVGVLPSNFHVPYGTDVWFPSRFGENERSIFILARLAPGVTLEQAQAGLEPMGRALSEQYPDLMRGLGVTAVQAREYFVNDDDRVALTLMGAVAFLLLIACSNVALLLTTKFASRRKEVAVRAALGCGRARQVRQFVTEGVLLFVAGGALGLMLALWLRDSLVVFLPDTLASDVGINGIPLDFRLMTFSFGLSMVAGVTFGLIAALRAGNADLNSVMKGGSRSVAGAASRGTLGTLVVVEVALALVLLTAAGMMVETFSRLQARDLGFTPAGILTMQVDLDSSRYESADARRAFLAQALERAGALPGVSAVGATTVNPLCCGTWGMRVTPEGFPPVSAAETPIIRHFIVTPGYFDAMRQPVRQGRAFTAADADGAEMTVIVDQGFADRFWPGQNPLGKRVKRGPLDSPYPWLTVVGVVAPVEAPGDYTEAWYLPHAQHAAGPSATGAHLMIRASGDPAALVPLVRAAAAEIDPNLALYEVTTMDALLADNLQQDRLGAMVTAMFAIAGLLLSSLGLYGVLSFVVNEDMREIGLRIALGASRGSVLALVVGRAVRMTMAGLGIGAVVAVSASGLFARLIEDAQPDWRIIAGASAVLLAAALAASVLPARRALKLDPLQALRSE
jgi:putative ABC transport system permease protein